jgi:hypothetical protein
MSNTHKSQPSLHLTARYNKERKTIIVSYNTTGVSKEILQRDIVKALLEKSRILIESELEHIDNQTTFIAANIQIFKDA